MINIASLTAPPTTGNAVVTEANTNGEVSTNFYKKVVIDTSNNSLRIKTSSYAFGELSFENNATVITPSGIAVPMLIALPSTLYNNTFFSSTANSRLTYTGSVSGTPFKIFIRASFFTATNNQNVSLFWARNGSVQTRGASKSTASSNAKNQLVIETIVTLNTNDYIEAYISNDTSTSNITVENLAILAVSIPM